LAHAKATTRTKGKWILLVFGLHELKGFFTA
jgi:hypothetical protein